MRPKALLDYYIFDSKRHVSIQGYFNKNYIASAFAIRTKSDYQDFYVVTKNGAKQLIRSKKRDLVF